jgi:hypothetical protein
VIGSTSSSTLMQLCNAAIIIYIQRLVYVLSDNAGPIVLARSIEAPDIDPTMLAFSPIVDPPANLANSSIALVSVNTIEITIIKRCSKNFKS